MASSDTGTPAPAPAPAPGIGWDPTAASVRSRASSVFSTGTRFSIATPSPEELQHYREREPPRLAFSPNYLARPQSLRTLGSHEQPAPPYEAQQEASSFVPQLPLPNEFDDAVVANPIAFPVVVENAIDGSPISPTTEVELENALTAHYGRVVRTIDENHARELLQITQAHERQLAAVRHEIDQAYRKEWKVKNREVEKVREEATSRVALLEADCRNLKMSHEATVARMQQEAQEQNERLLSTYENTIDKARNEIEDLWEARWSDRIRLATEEAQRTDLMNQRKLEQAVADRDEEWERELGCRHPDLVDELKRTISELRRGK